MTKIAKATGEILAAKKRVAKANSHLARTVNKHFPVGSDVYVKSHGASGVTKMEVTNCSNTKCLGPRQVGVRQTGTDLVIPLDIPYVLENMLVGYDE